MYFSSPNNVRTVYVVLADDKMANTSQDVYKLNARKLPKNIVSKPLITTFTSLLVGILSY